MSNVASTLLPFLATMSKQRSTLLPKTATMSNDFCVEISSFRQSRTLLRHCCPNGNIVKATGNKVACCFDNVALTLLRVWTGLKLTALATVDVKWREKQKNRLSTKFVTGFEKKYLRFLEIPNFPFNTVYEKPKIASAPNTSFICSTVSIQYRLVTDSIYRTTHMRCICVAR